MVIDSAASFGEAVRSLRRRQRLTQGQLAMIAGVGPRFIVELEDGKETAQLGRALTVLKALGGNLALDGGGDESGGALEDLPPIGNGA